MRRGLKKWSIRVGAGIAVAVAFLSLLFWFLAVTSLGHGVLAKAIGSLSGGRVRIENLSGDMFSRLTADRVFIADRKGQWLRVDKLDLRWRALALLGNHADIAELRARRVAILRRPLSSGDSSQSDFRLDIALFDIDRIEIDHGVFGRAGVLRARGSVHYASLHNASARLAVDRIDGEGQYRINLTSTRGHLYGDAHFAERGDGFAGSLAGLPNIGAVQLTFTAGMRGERNDVVLALTAGALHANAEGAVDLDAGRLRGTFRLDAPAMHPRPDLSWNDLNGEGIIDGSFAEPVVKISLQANGLAISGINAGAVKVDVAGQGGNIELTGVLQGLRISGDRDAFAAAPLRLSAHLDLGDSMPLHISADHPLLDLRGDLRLAGSVGGHMTLDLPRMQSLAAIAGIDLDGHAQFSADIGSVENGLEAKLSGALVASGTSPLARLLGQATLTATWKHRRDGSKVVATLQGARLRAGVSGSSTGTQHDYRGEVTISNLSQLSSALVGTFALNGRLSGEDDDLNLMVRGRGAIAPRGVHPEVVILEADVGHLSTHPVGSFRIFGRFAGAPVNLVADTLGTHFALQRASWKSLFGSGDLTLSPVPQGRMFVSIGNLGDLQPFGTHLAGSAEVQLLLKAQGTTSRAVLDARLHDFSTDTVRADDAVLTGGIDIAGAAPHVGLTLRASQVSVGDVAGAVTATLSGPVETPAVEMDAHLTSAAGALTLKTAGRIDLERTSATISSLTAAWNGKAVALAAPARLMLSDGVADVDVTLRGDSATAFAVKGKFPFDDVHPFDLHLSGKANLAGWTDLLSAGGRSMRGKATFDADVRGRADRPQVLGRATLQNGQYRDFTSGVSLSGIDVVLVADGDRITLERLKAMAGSGTLEGAGTIDLAGDKLVKLSIRAVKASPFARDGVSLVLNGETTLSGPLAGDLSVGGNLQIDKGEIRIPDRLPANVAVLDVRRAQHASVLPVKPGRLKLALTVSSSGRLFIRGRGLDAELEGNLQIAGSSAPRVSGKLTMRRGGFSLAGTMLEFQSGSIGFSGTGASGRLDPTLDFVASTTANGTTATLKIAGTVSAPKVELSSSPVLPQDEILSHLLFQQSVQQLSPVQLAQIAQSLAVLSGVGDGIDPLGAVRGGLGLDRLTLGSAAGADGASATTTVEAGKYVLRGVYVGAKQNLAGGTRALVQVDLGRHLKLRASANAGGGSAVPSTRSQDNGDTVGLSYQFDY